VEKVSRRQVLRETGLHGKTLRKILQHSEPPGYRQQKPGTKKKLGPYLERIEEILKDDKAMARKQRHTAKRLWERLKEEGFTGGYTAVKDAVVAWRAHCPDERVPRPREGWEQTEAIQFMSPAQDRRSIQRE